MSRNAGEVNEFILFIREFFDLLNLFVIL